MKSQTLVDRTVDCPVCGKVFPRGALDLARHQNALTLQHLTSTKKSNTFPFGCKRCNLFFAEEDHLNIHNESSRCKRGKAIISPRSSPSPLLLSGTEEDEDEAGNALSAETRRSLPDRTVECMVCGKLFPRGITIILYIIFLLLPVCFCMYYHFVSTL